MGHLEFKIKIFLVRAFNFVKRFGGIFVVNECKSRAACRGPKLHLLFAPSCIHFVRCLTLTYQVKNIVTEVFFYFFFFLHSVIVRTRNETVG